MAARSQSTEKVTIKLSGAEVKALDALAEQLRTSREEALKVAFLRGVQIAQEQGVPTIDEAEIERRTRIVESLRIRREEIRAKTGNIPDIKALIDEGRDI